MPYPFTYRVVTESSSAEDTKMTDDGFQILVETNNFQVAKKECIEWAAFDDIFVEVLNRYGSTKFSCDGESEAMRRYPKTALLPR